MYLVFSVVILGLVIGALVDIITADQWRIKHLDKVFWIIIVILLPFIGSILWFAIGREYAQPLDRGSFGDPRRREAPAPSPSTTELELEALEREIVAQQNEDRIRKLEAELRARRESRDFEG